MTKYTKLRDSVEDRIRWQLVVWRETATGPLQALVGQGSVATSEKVQYGYGMQEGEATVAQIDRIDQMVQHMEKDLNRFGTAVVDLGNKVDANYNSLYKKIDERFDTVDKKISHFTWLLIIAIIGVVLEALL